MHREKAPAAQGVPFCYICTRRRALSFALPRLFDKQRLLRYLFFDFGQIAQVCARDAHEALALIRERNYILMKMWNPAPISIAGLYARSARYLAFSCLTN